MVNIVLCPNLVANSYLFAPFKLKNWCPAWQLAEWREEGGNSHKKAISSSTAGEHHIISVWK